jgi:hypothetical protein
VHQHRPGIRAKAADLVGRNRRTTRWCWSVNEKPQIQTVLIVTRLDQPGGHLQRREQRHGAMAFILMVETGQRIAIEQLSQPWARSSAGR